VQGKIFIHPFSCIVQNLGASPQLEYWSDGFKGKNFFDLILHYSITPYGWQQIECRLKSNKFNQLYKFRDVKLVKMPITEIWKLNSQGYPEAFAINFFRTAELAGRLC